MQPPSNLTKDTLRLKQKLSNLNYLIKNPIYRAYGVLVIKLMGLQ